MMLQPSKISEPIPGYAVQQRIGVGGYGEVWSASAPGGLTKAIKFVYGYFDDARASRELKALDRIKQVRHPFLLSLERFEVVDGQLVIVTELADMSMKDRYEQVKAAGQSGIARDELLGYLRDAADALDYMSTNFSLQHLDVKPENLLLVGGRVKVADFGLVKDLHDVTASLMGGLTPIYAAPEVFDDRPSQRSDQYSLAIVYQEMLTGGLPFPGRTSAQLASQHLHARPRLATLPENDQPVIARALSKNPGDRFSSCREMVDALLNADRPRDRQSGPEARRVDSTSDTTSNKSAASKTDTDHLRHVHPTAERTQVLGERGQEARATQQRGVQQQAFVAQAAVELPPLELSDSEAPLRATLFIGVGGTAARTLRRLRQRLRDRLGDLRSVPAVQMLLFDTDAKSVFQSTQGDPQTALDDDEVVALPLRQAHDYTHGSNHILQWLSRRWLYNIPRSLQTEGRRPLGRLALVDHAQHVTRRVRAALETITSDGALAASAQITGQTFDGDAPRVIILASTSGGTGGGMVLDLPYLVRQTLTEMGCSDSAVCGVLTHSTDRNPAASDLAKANTYALLSELAHYATTGRYPGEPTLGLPSAGGHPCVFPHTYFVHLGDDLSDAEFDVATDNLASYLYLGTFSTAARALDQCRQSDLEQEARGAALRTFGLATVGGLQTTLPLVATEQLCREVIERWRGTHKQPAVAAAPASLIDMAADSTAAAAAKPLNEIEEAAAAHAARHGVEVEPLLEQAIGVVENELGGDAETVLAKLRSSVDRKQKAGPGQRGPMAQLLHAVNSLLGSSIVEEGGAQPPVLPLHTAMERDLKVVAAPLGATIRDWLLEVVEDPAGRVAAAYRAKEWYAGQLRTIEAKSTEMLHAAQHALKALEQILLDSEHSSGQRGKVFRSRRGEKSPADLEGALVHVVQLKFHEAAAHGLRKLVRLLAAQVSNAGEQIKDLQRELGQLSRAFPAITWPVEAASEGGPLKVFEEARLAMTRSLRDRLPELAERVDERVRDLFLNQHDGLLGICGFAEPQRGELVTELRNLAREEVLAALAEVPLANTLVTAEMPAEIRDQRLKACLEAAQPQLTGCGGGQRLLVVLPPHAAESQLRASVLGELDPPATVVVDADAELVFCYEAQDMPLAGVAARLIEDRHDFARIAGRLHTRTDVSWSGLTEAPAPV